MMIRSAIGEMREIALLIETSHGCGRGLLRGVSRYMHEVGNWSIRFEPHAKGYEPVEWLTRCRVDGVLAQVRNPEMAAAIRDMEVPVVDLCGEGGNIRFPYVGVDPNGVAKEAFDHLASRGFTSFGLICRARGEDHRMDEKADAFERLIGVTSWDCCTLSVPLGSGIDPWPAAKEHMFRWLPEVPKPIGIFVGHDILGIHLLAVCRQLGIAVPDEVAVVGMGNDEVISQLAQPSLSSVNVDQRQIGYHAAKLLDQLVGGTGRRRQSTLLAPSGVVARESTQVFACNVREVNEALKFIRRNSCRKINPTDVARHVRVSRSLLDVRMRETIGRTIHQEIRYLQVERMKHLLANTDLPIKRVAREVGILDVAYMTRVFGTATGVTPGEYRKQKSLR